MSLYWTHLACLFPQHAPGTKAPPGDPSWSPWQSAIMRREPWRFLRGCIRSDGCVFVNRTGPYSYISYQFSNHSPGHPGVFTLCL